MVMPVLAVSVGLLSGIFYSTIFCKKYRLLMLNKSVSEDVFKNTKYQNRFIISHTFNTAVRLILLTGFLGLLFVYYAVNPFFWFIGFLFSFWYGVLNNTELNGKNKMI